MVKLYRTTKEIKQFKNIIRTTPFGSLSDKRIKKLIGKNTKELLTEKTTLGSLCVNINNEFFIVFSRDNFVNIGTIDNVSLKTLIETKNIFKEILKYRVFCYAKVSSINKTPLRIFKPKIIRKNQQYSIIVVSYEDI